MGQSAIHIKTKISKQLKGLPVFMLIYSRKKCYESEGSKIYTIAKKMPLNDRPVYCDS